MPFLRPSLTDLRTQVAQAIQSALPGSDAALRFQVLKAIGNAVAGLSHAHYAYLAWIARQAVPYTAEAEYLEAWAALKKVYRNSPTTALGIVTFTGIVGRLIPSGTAMARADGALFTSTADATVAATGVALVPVLANADPTGLTGAFGNTSVGVQMSLSSPINGVSGTGTVSQVITGGTDLETDDSLRARMLDAYQTRPEGGSLGDYKEWALSVPGITRAWINGSGYGAGTVVIYIMLDAIHIATGGFPAGTDGVSQYETRATAATGDQLTVANAIWPLQSVTALVYVVSPIAQPQDFTITGLSLAGSVVQAACTAAIASMIKQTAAPGGTVNLSDIEGAVAAVPGSAGFVITSPTSNIATGIGHLLQLGVVTYS